MSGFEPIRAAYLETMRTKTVAAISAATVLILFTADASFAVSSKNLSNAHNHSED
jgi:hypothetical protein